MSDDALQPPLPHHDSIDRLTRALENAYPPPLRLFGRSVLMGVGTGLGATVGVTLLMTLLGYIFNVLGYIDAFRPSVQVIQQQLAPPHAKNSPVSSVKKKTGRL